MKRIVAATVIALLMAYAVLHVSVRAYLAGDAFHRLVENRAGRAFGGEVELSALRWDGARAFGDSMRVRTGEGAEILARHLRADWNWRAVFSGAWRLEEVSVESLEGTFGQSQASPNIVPDSKAPLFGALLPKRFELGSAKIQKVDLSFGDISLRGSSLEIEQESGAWKISGRGGALNVSGWPAVVVESFRGRLAGEGFAIDASLLRTGEAGNIKASGTWPGRVDLEWTNVRLADLPEARWRKFMSGTLTGNAVVDAGGARGKFRIENGRFSGSPWLETLAALTGIREFQKLEFSHADGDFEVRESDWRVTNLFLESGGLLRVEGNVEVMAAQKLSGELRVGVAAKALRGMPGVDVMVFSNERDGYFWAPVALGGTLDSPTEDLTARLAAAAGEAVMESVRPVPERARDAVGDTINVLFEILGR